MLDAVFNAINDHAKRSPNKLALVDAESEITYRELTSQILTKSSGITQSDLFFPLSLANDIESVIDYFATRVAGRIPQVTHPSVSNISRTNNQEHQRLVSNLILERNLPGADAMMSSGSTGEPKQVLVDFEAQNITTTFLNSKASLIDQDVELLVLPISYSSGLGRLRAALSRGSTSLLVKSPVRFKRLIQMCGTHPPTSIGLSPSTFRYISRSLGSQVSTVFKDINSVEFGSASLTQLDIEQMNLVFRDSRIKMLHYGLTEASRSSYLDLIIQNKSDAMNIGEVTPHATITLEKTSDGRFDEIVISGRHLAFAVLDGKNISLIEKVHTGDIGRESEGRITLSGRLAYVVNVGGKDMFPAVLEDFCSANFPNVEFVVIGVEDALLGEVPVLITTERIIDESAILSKISEQFEAHWVPRTIWKIDDMPVLPNGKIDRVTLKNRCNQNVN